MSPIYLLLLAANAWPGPVGQAPPPAPPQATQAAPAPADTSFERRLTALELALSATVVERPNLWRFEGLEAEASALMAAAKTEQQRSAVRQIADRLDRFATIAAQHRRTRELAGGWRAPGAAPRESTAIAPPVQLTKAGPERPRGEYDAQGVLRPVVSKRPDAPKYAVVDDKGRLAALVTPAPEVAPEFDGLIGKRVGLTGQRGYRTDLKREHVVAERVTPLGTLRR